MHLHLKIKKAAIAKLGLFRKINLTIEINDLLMNDLTLKGESQGHNAIFKGLKMTFRTKIKKTIPR